MEGPPDHNQEQKLIIATKGHQCTGKSTLAFSLAKLCKYPLIKLDHIRHSISQLQTSLKTDPQTHNSPAIDDDDELSYESVCRMASKLLQLRHSVVIDCPLSDQTHFEKLKQLSSSSGSTLVIVECKPRDTFEWQLWVERRSEYGSSGSRSEAEKRMKKINDWEKVVDYVKSYEDYDVGDIPKLIVNTTGYLKDFALARAVYKLAMQKKGGRVDFHEWVARGFASLDGVSGTELLPRPEFGMDDLINHFHEFKLFDHREDRHENGNLCKKCNELISESNLFYTCNNCKLFLHKSCAEFSSREFEQEQGMYLLPFMRRKENDYEYCFQDEQICDSCEKSGRGFSYECTQCLFSTHLRSNLLSTVIVNHVCHEEHALFLGMFRIPDCFEYLCRACGETGRHVGYVCMDCHFVIHVGCAYLPVRRKEKRHMHTLKLVSPSPSKERIDIDDSEELYCDGCETRMNPKHWMYYCDECDFPAHLDCAKAISSLG